MRTPSRRIEYNSFDDIIRIKPIFDVHYGSKACDVKAFYNFMADSDKNTYFIFCGDLFDSIVTTDPRYRKSNDVTEGDAIIDELVDWGEKVLTPYKNRILGIGKGNHEDVITKKYGTDPIARLCKRLGVEDIGYSGLYKLQLTKVKNGKFGGTRKIIIRYHHGWGGGSRTQGADLTKFSKDIAYWQADIFLYGHVHRRQTDSIPRLGLSGDKLISKPKILCICGTFLKTYTSSIHPTYSEVRGYPPVEIGGCLVTIKPQRHWVKIKARLD